MQESNCYSLVHVKQCNKRKNKFFFVNPLNKTNRWIEVLRTFEKYYFSFSCYFDCKIFLTD